MPSWAQKRKLFYLGIVLLALILLLGIPAYFLFNRPGTCFDGVQNNDEVGVDCGGSCQALCEAQTTDLVILWSRYFKARDGAYDAVAFVENPNVNAGIREAKYSFRLYNKDGILIAERQGRTYINPNERFAIFESGISTKEQIPTRAFFEFSGAPEWKQISRNKPELIVRNKRLQEEPLRPEVKATLVNQSLTDYKNITVVALLFNGEDIALAVAKTVVSDLPQNSSSDLTFILPQPLPEAPARIEIIPRLNETLGN